MESEGRGSQDSDHQKPVQKRYQTLLPATDSTPIGAFTRSLLSEPRKLPPKRRLVLVACLRCRTKKEKCDGGRPSCGRCISKETECQYEVDDARTSRSSALRRKCDSLEEENTQLNELFCLLRKKPRAEAEDILSRLRNAEEPVSVLKTIKEAELLLPCSSPEYGSESAPERRKPQETEASAENLSAQAPAAAQIKVRASPWTAVARRGVVSDLISSFFAWDNLLLYSFVDRESFLKDMELGNPKEARYCSPFLVNAICATQCFNSVRAGKAGVMSGADLQHRFLQEAKELLALEAGRSSLTTAQGLALLFSISIYNVIDRPNLSYRYSYCEMLKKLNLEGRLSRIRNDPNYGGERQALARALWGFFIFESIVASGYFHAPSLSMPRVDVAGAFPDNLNSMSSVAPTPPLERADSFQSTGTVLDDRTYSPAGVHGYFDACADIAKLLYESMCHNADYSFDTGSAEDLRTRRGLYSKLTKLPKSWPAALRPEARLSPQSCLLSAFYNDVAISILRPLRPGIILEPSFESVKEVCLRHCESTVDLLDRYTQSWPEHHTFMMVWCAYNIACTLVLLLDDPATHGLLLRCCEFISQTTKDYPVSSYVLHGVQALAWALKVQLPPSVISYFEKTTNPIGEQELRDAPTGLTMPFHGDLRHSLRDHEKDWIFGTPKGMELGFLLAKWSERAVTSETE